MSMTWGILFFALASWCLALAGAFYTEGKNHHRPSTIGTSFTFCLLAGITFAAGIGHGQNYITVAAALTLVFLSSKPFLLSYDYLARENLKIIDLYATITCGLIWLALIWSASWLTR